MVERWAENPKVAGSTPVSNTELNLHDFIVRTILTWKYFDLVVAILTTILKSIIPILLIKAIITAWAHLQVLLASVELIFKTPQPTDLIVVKYIYNKKANEVIDLWNLISILEENTSNFTKTPVMANLIALSFVFAIIHYDFNKTNYRPYYLMKYAIISLSHLFQFTISSLWIWTCKAKNYVYNWAISKNIFASKIIATFYSFVLIWRPLFKRVSYYGKFIRTRNFWKNK